MVPSTMLRSLAAVAMLAAQNTALAMPSPSSDLVARQAGTTGYGYMGCFSETQDVGDVFSSNVAVEYFGNGVSLNSVCSALCRSHSTQYYATIDYEGQCACGNQIGNTTTYEVSAVGCQPCGIKSLDESYVTGPGICGDYYAGAVAVYSLNF